VAAVEARREERTVATALRGAGVDAGSANGNGSPEAARGIAADELARRANTGSRILDVPAQDLEAWLLDTELAVRTPAGLLVPTALGVELGKALGPL
jgi:hypothetical protein